MRLLRNLVLGLALAAAVLVAAFFGWRAYQKSLRPNFARDGGTVLVYEVDPRQPAGTYNPDDLAAALHRRLDRHDLWGIVVRPIDDRRVEVSVPRREGRHGDDVAQVKDLLMLSGTLEFRILANSDDDKEVFDSVQHNPAEYERLKAATLSEGPPPAPRPIAGQAFDTDLGAFTYSWRELAGEERRFYALDNDQQDSPFRQEMEEARKDRKAVFRNSGGGKYRGNLFWSRAVRNPGRLPEKDRDKKYEYFILTRDPALGDDGRPQAVNGHLLAEAYETLDRDDHYAIGFTFNAEGKARLADLTAKNERRQVAIILDDVVRSAPNVEEPITGGSGIIRGQFSKEDIDRMVNILRAGALPVALKPLPISETTVAPTK